MMFKNIPQATPLPTYHVDHFVSEMPRVIGRYQERGLVLNPDFQRGHVWTEEQQTSYMESLLHGSRSGKEFYLNHPGWMNGWEGDFVCVDGLQRITSMLRFMNNEIPAFGSLLEGYEDNFPLSLSVSFWINDLKTKEQVLNWYLEINDTGTAHSEAELERVRKMLRGEQ